MVAHICCSVPTPKEQNIYTKLPFYTTKNLNNRKNHLSISCQTYISKSDRIPYMHVANLGNKLCTKKIKSNMDKLSEKIRSETRTRCKRKNQERKVTILEDYSKQKVKAKKDKTHERILNIESGENSNIEIQRSPQ